jgi:hypothetical protein
VLPSANAYNGIRRPAWSEHPNQMSCIISGFRTSKFNRSLSKPIEQAH